MKGEKDYSDGIGSEKAVLVSCSNDRYHEAVIEISRLCSSRNQKTCFVGFVRPCLTTISELKNAKIQTGKFVFIDAISGLEETLIAEDSVCIFTPSPQELTKLAVAIFSALEKYKFSSLILDSLNILFVFSSHSLSLRFLQSIVTKLRAVDVQTILISVKDEKLLDITNVKMFVDKTVDIE